MGDKEARALGSGDRITVGDREYTLSPTRFGALEEVQREALRSYKQAYLQTFKDNPDLFDEDTILRKVEETARWDISSLPKKRAYSVASVPLTDALLEELKCISPEMYAQIDESDNQGKLALLNTYLDQGRISKEKVEELSGKSVFSSLIPYDMWWVTSNYAGMRCFVRSSLQVKHPNVTDAELKAWPLGKLILAAKIVEKLTTPEVGNM